MSISSAFYPSDKAYISSIVYIFSCDNGIYFSNLPILMAIVYQNQEQIATLYFALILLMRLINSSLFVVMASVWDG